MATRAPRYAGAVLVACSLACAAGVAGGEPRALEWKLEVEGGAEYDSNLHRLDVAPDTDVDIEGSPLARGGARLRLQWRPRESEQVRFAGFGGAKLFASETGQGENVMVGSGDLRYERVIRSRRSIVGARVIYYDASGYRPFGGDTAGGPGRNFSLGDGQLTLTLMGPKGHRFQMTGGYARFSYKPDEDFDWRGDKWAALYRATFWRGNPDEDLDAATIDLDFAYAITRRSFRGKAFTNVCGPATDADPSCFFPTVSDRFDMHHAASAEAVYTGDRIWSARYAVSVTDSNSYGQSLVRQRLELGVTTETWREVFLTAKLALQLDTFLDPLLLARDVQSQSFVTIDDENRNAVSLHVARDVSKKWTLEARYALFSNEFATRELSFRRHIVYSGVVYRYR